MLRNLGIYAVGSIGSRLMTFLLVPIYSFFISPSEFGYYDICFAAILLMTPIISFQLREGAFRFLLDTKNDDERAQIVSFAILTRSACPRKRWGVRQTLCPAASP